jgi:DNA-binding CsgD family transcriptional regulator
MAGTQFVGRGGELDRLGRVLRGEPAAGQVAVVTGDAGIGKTRLVAEAVRAAPDVLVLAGACLPLSESLPYGAVTDALADLTSPASRPALDRALGRCATYVRPQMAALIPALSDEPRGTADLSADRTRLFAAVKDLLRALGTDRRTSLVVEDLHWADSGTLDLLTFLVRGRMSDGTCLVVTSRHDELPPDDLVLDWLASTVRVPGVEPVVLASLSDDDVELLIASLVDSEPAESLLADVVRRGEGNPFFTEQLVAAANDVGPPLEMPPGVPPGVAQMLLSRVRSVSALAVEVAAVLAVAARPLDESELTVCTGKEVDVAEGLRELFDARLLETADRDRYRLRHALLEDTVRGTLLASHRAGLHAAVARVLAARGDESPAEIAAHWSRAGNRGEEARWSVRAARHAEGVFAWREASACWHRVWELWTALAPEARPPTGLAEAVVATVVDAARSDDDANFHRLVEKALADDRITSDDQATGQLLRRQGERLASVDRTASLAALERAVAVFDSAGQPSAEQARALQALAQTKIFYDIRTGTENEELERATVIAEQVGAVDVLIEIEGDRSTQRLLGGDVEEGLRGLTAASTRAQQAGTEHVANETAVNLSDAYIWLLRLPEGIDVGLRAIERALAHGYRDSMDFSTLVVNTIDGLLLSGDPDAAEQLLSPYLLAEVTSSGWPLHIARAELDLLGGDLDGALARIEQLQDMDDYADDEMQMWLGEVGAAAELWKGQPASALARTERTWAVFEASFLASRGSRLLALAARAAADTSDVDPHPDRTGLARLLRDRAMKAQCFAPHPGRVLGAAFGVTFEAELARLLRHGGEAEWRAARDTWAGHDVPHQAAYAGWRLSEQLVATGRRKDAEAELVAAYAMAETHVPLRREIEGFARRARLPLSTSAETQPPQLDMAHLDDTRHGLTARELDVLRLLGTGATNAEIGRQLYMSPKTASVHVSSIIRKLGVTGRVQAATVAERMGLLEHE